MARGDEGDLGAGPQPWVTFIDHVRRSSPRPGPVLSSSPSWKTKRDRGVCGPYAKTGRWKQESHRPLELQLCHQPLSPDLSESVLGTWEARSG